MGIVCLVCELCYTLISGDSSPGNTISYDICDNCANGAQSGGRDMSNPFAGLPNAPMPGNYGPKFRHGNYRVEVNLFACKPSKKVANQWFALLEATIIEQLPGCFDDSNEVGERCSKVFMFQAGGWEGQYAMGAMKACIAGMLQVDFDDITDVHAMQMTGSRMEGNTFIPGDGTDAAGVTMRILATDSDKTDDKGQPYVNLEFGADE